MNHLALGIMAIIVIIYVLISSYIQNKKRTMNRIRSQFGSIPYLDLEKERIKRLLDSEKYIYDIDDITWNDLDMDKIFARINNCNSFVGEQVLYKRLHVIEHDKEEVENREKLIREFTTDEKRREEVQVLLDRIGKRENSYNLPHFVAEAAMFQITDIWIYRVMSSLLAGTLLIGIFNQYFLIAAGGIFLINLLLYAFKRMHIEVQLELMGTVSHVITIANTFINKYKINNGKLAQENIESIKKLSKLVKRIAFIQRKMELSRSGEIRALITDYLLGATLFDFHIFHKIVKMLITNKDEFMKIYMYVGGVDETISIASFRKSLTQYYLPDFQEKNTIHMGEMYHPLIDDPVCNDVKMDSNYIVTGSNASGKSTYIKAIAVNMILAQSINTVMAKSAEIPYANVLTSMAVRDDGPSLDHVRHAADKNLSHVCVVIILALCSQSFVFFLATAQNLSDCGLRVLRETVCVFARKVD